MTVQALLTAATWGQGLSAMRPGRLCLGEAVNQIYRGDPERLQEVYALLQHTLNRKTRARAFVAWNAMKCIVRWNDAPGRTFAEVERMILKLGL